MSTDAPRRYALDPDPAWDFHEERDGVLVVELSWKPDALAGRLADLVASPELVEALSTAGLTGYRTGEAQGYYREDSFDVAEGEEPPPLVRLIVDGDPGADFAYDGGLTVSERALAVLRPRCQNLQVDRKSFI